MTYCTYWNGETECHVPEEMHEIYDGWQEAKHAFVRQVYPRSSLRSWLGELGTKCEFPECGDEATQMAHIDSIGMGGRKSADRTWNVMRACDDHALITDGLPPVGGGVKELVEEYREIPGWEKKCTHHEGMQLLRTHVLNERGPNPGWAPKRPSATK